MAEERRLVTTAAYETTVDSLDPDGSLDPYEDIEVKN